ncbi:type IV pilus modification PilV family protein [Moorella sulfitireducens]|uniref:type IV pilus modification PilV family protein n=1 Tax=Neomoorella sulfitireducens TaxID=2972948 RepID=UPI0021ACA2A4|nr:type II secretion system protein [Moorella sulfitireducens]
MKRDCLPVNNRGLTLVEVLVATAILAAVLVPMLGMFTTAARGYTRGGQETVVLNLARERMETCLAAGYNGLAGLPGAGETWQAYPGRPGYEYQIITTDYEPFLQVKEVVVRVRPAHGTAGEVELATLVARWP